VSHYILLESFSSSFPSPFSTPYHSFQWKNRNSWTFHPLNVPLIMNQTTTMSNTSCSDKVGWNLNPVVTALNLVEMMKLHRIIKRQMLLFGAKNPRNTPLECCMSYMVAPHRTTTPSRGGGSCSVTVRDWSFERQVVQSANVLSFMSS